MTNPLIPSTSTPAFAPGARLARPLPDPADYPPLDMVADRSRNNRRNRKHRSTRKFVI